ncbi:hypothetical protein GOP47_0019549 [Adiantum capillus-veneris]|uniref:Uncharacterized protein n=1 Tax=Adiantum capillus-veneris TaxID=13818 RepID=A0A9D4Z7X2_ADICA|nr:hypothetical protein GOP47_0019549 [Adiantum capillus-veneris]
MATEDAILPEEVWLADKERCDVVVCVKERQDPGPPFKKRLLGLQVTNSPAESSRARIHVEKKQVQQPQVVMVYTMSDRLAKSPYFRVCLKEPWSKEEYTEDGCTMALTLETLLASIQGYKKCIEILCSSQPCSPYMFSSPSEALDIYLASDHLLFKECSEACMDFISAAPWSSEEEKVIHGTFANSSIVPSREVAARLGLSKEKPVSNLKDTLWDLYESCYYGESEDAYLPCQLFNLIEGVLKGLSSTSRSNVWSKKAISEFLYEAANDCVEAMKSSLRDEWMLTNRSFLCWLRMTELLLELTDGKESVMAVASDDDLCDFLLPALRVLTDKTYPPRTENAGTVRQVVKLLIEIFKRVATAKVILSASARTSLVKRWVPWFESIRTNEKVCEANDMPILKAHIKTVIDTLGMDDGELLNILAHASMRSEYFLEGGFRSWCSRLDQS